MDATDRNLGTIFDMNLRIVAPLFQRPYVWNKGKNWEPLWEGIQEVAERRLANDLPRPRFLGAIVLDQLPTQTGDVEARQVIDGQQRLTTLQIVLAAMRDICKEKGSENYNEAFRRLTTNFVTSKKFPEAAYKVWPTNKDREYFSSVIDSGSKEALLAHYGVLAASKDLEHLIPNAYLFFHSVVIEWIGEAGEDELESKLESLLTAMRQDLLMVVIDLGEKDDAQMIFETLNALGTPLLPADLVKNFLFHLAEAEGYDIEELYNKYWSGFDENTSYWRKEVRQGRLNRPRIDLYLHHYLTLKKQEDIGATHLFASFKDHMKNGKSKGVEGYIASLKDYSEVYSSFEKYPQDSREGLFFYRLAQLDTNTVYPILLEVFHSVKDTKERTLILDDIESYLVRRAICCLTQKNYNRFFVELVKRLSENGFTSVNVREYLLAKDADTSRWPDDSEIFTAFVDTPMYSWVKRANLRMILEGIEIAKWDSKSEKIQIIDKLTIEHVLPQAWREHWTLPDGSSVEDEIARDKIIHSIGNLTLLTKQLNPSVSNGSWSLKKDELAKHSALTMNRELIASDNWAETQIKKRSSELSMIACNVWEYPNPKQG